MTETVTYDVFKKQRDTKVRHAQVVYLYALGKSLQDIADITGYTLKTIPKFIKQYTRELMGYAMKIFGRIKEGMADLKEVVFRMNNPHLVESKINLSNQIDANGYDINIDGHEWCYLFEFYDIDNKLVCSKVGTTTRTIRKRLEEELEAYKKIDVVSAKVNRVYDCGKIPAEGLESLIRSEYIRKYPSAFKKNDRFFNVVFDLDKCDEIVKNYLA